MVADNRPIFFYSKARSDHSNSAAKALILNYLINFFQQSYVYSWYRLSVAINCVTYWLQQNHCSMNEPLEHNFSYFNFQPVGSQNYLTPSHFHPL